MTISHRNMNDFTVEGIKYCNIVAFTVQFHPEASPGPNDTAYLFDEFLEVLIKLKKENKTSSFFISEDGEGKFIGGENSA